MKAAIYNPYFDTLGGGERYTLAVATSLLEAGYGVDIEWDLNIKEKAEKRFGISLKGVNFVEDIKRGDGYDLCFWLSDGSIPALKARKNILHFQIPFHGVNGNTLINRMKFFRINRIICNSNLTKKFIDREYGVTSIVLYPPVDTSNIKPARKENLILFVGRFSGLLQAKKQDVLVGAFKDLSRRGYKNWRLCLAGGIEVGAHEFVNEVKKLAEGYSIKIFESPDFKEIKNLYGKAKIFWSAVGYGADETLNPEKVEHFGITVVEAMAAGAVPIVYGAGGYKEIVKPEFGEFWNDPEILVAKTIDLIEKPKKLETLANAGVKASKEYSYDRFKREFLALI